MPRDVPRKAIDPHPYWGAKGRRVGDIRKYLLITRTARDDDGAWDKVKPAADLNKLKAAGKYLDLWQWRAARSNAVGYASDDWVLEYRNGDAGRSPFFNPPKPQFMYDEKTTGFQAIPESQLEARMGQAALIEKKNAVPLDPNAKFAVRGRPAAPVSPARTGGKRRRCPGVRAICRRTLGCRATTQIEHRPS